MNETLKTEFGSRLVTLANGAQGLRGSIKTIATTPTDAGTQPIIDFRSSDGTLDRYEETIVASGWKLANYQANPVFQNSHKYGDILFTLGKSLITEIRNNDLFQRILFAVDINPVAKIAYQMYRDKFLNAVSVGFIPIRWENGTDAAGYRRKYIEQELLELSAVSIPANPNALQLAYKAGSIDKSDLKDLHDLVQMLCHGAASGSSLAPARGEGQGEGSPSTTSKILPTSKEGTEPDTSALGSGSDCAHELRALLPELRQLIR